MLVTLLVLYYVRPVLRSRTRRRKALSIMLVAASLVTSNGQLQSADGQDRYGAARRSDASSSVAIEQHVFDAGDETSLFGGQQIIREGTIIPPTIGRVVNLGRRWAFVPIEDAMPSRRASDSPLQRKWNGSSLVRTADGNHLDAVSDSAQSIVLSENQMLQRIVEAMKADMTDDRWELSGEILEFFDENRLLIRTVQRANGN